MSRSSSTRRSSSSRTSSRRGLTRQQAREVRGLLLTANGRAIVLDKIAPVASDERLAWTWGRKLGRPTLIQIWEPPARVGVVCTIEKTLYRAAKGKGSGVDTWEHKHEPPFMLLASAPRASLETTRVTRTRRSSDAVRPTGKAVIRLGEALEIEGTDPSGHRVLVSFKRRRVLLVGEPHTRRMMIAGASLAVLRNGSPCLVTADGLVR